MVWPGGGLVGAAVTLTVVGAAVTLTVVGAAVTRTVDRVEPGVVKPPG